MIDASEGMRPEDHDHLVQRGVGITNLVPVATARADQLTDVTCPIFLVAGQFDQLGIDLRTYERSCRDPRVRVIPRASHLAPLTHRDQVAAVLREAVSEAAAAR